MRRFLILVLALSALAAGAAAAASSPIKGTFGTHITGTSSPLDATWRVKIAASGAYTITRNGSSALHGKAKVSGTTVAFTDAGGPFACKGAVKTGTYTWSFSKRGGTRYLILTLRRDGCAGRRTILTQPLATI